MIVKSFSYKERCYLNSPAAVEGFENEVARYKSAVEPLPADRREFHILSIQTHDVFEGVFVFNRQWYFYHTFERDESRIDIRGPYTTDMAIAITIARQTSVRREDFSDAVKAYRDNELTGPLRRELTE